MKARPESGKAGTERNKLARHGAIREVIRGHAVATQEELGRLLEQRGISVTQATLSRDLAQLGAVRVARPGGGTVYELDGPSLPPVGDRLRALGPLVLSLADNEAITVVRTQPGAAQAVARAIDVARLPACLGTLAGDDTIFVTPVRGTPARRLSASLRALFGLAGKEV